MYTDPQPPFESWEELYPEDYPAHQIPTKPRRWHTSWRKQWDRWLLSLYRGYHAEGRGSHRGRLATIMAPLLGRCVDPYVLPAPSPKGARLLDFGCGSGRYLAKMRSLGWDVLGVDLSERAVKQARQAFDVPAVVGSIPSRDLPANSFDLITAWEVLEHLQRPRQALAGIRALLRHGGRLVLTVPNQTGWAARYFGPDWVGLDLPRHLTHFSPATLGAMLNIEGFRVIHMSTICHSGWIRHSAKRHRARNPSLRVGLLTTHAYSSLISRLAKRSGRAESIYVVAQPVDK
ncbi:MAG: class I SAM-dependent methyltransferase [Planctomycetota bacterium]